MENRKNVLAVQGVNVPLIANLRIRTLSLFIKRVPTQNQIYCLWTLYIDSIRFLCKI